MQHRIFAVDDHPVMLDACLSVIGLEPDLAPCGSATSGAEALGMITALGSDCDLVVADYRMPGMSGAELVRHLRAVRPTLPVIVVSAHEDDVFAREAMDAGAAAFLPKRDLVETLVPTIRAVLDRLRRSVP